MCMYVKNLNPIVNMTKAAIEMELCTSIEHIKMTLLRGCGFESENWPFCVEFACSTVVGVL